MSFIIVVDKVAFKKRLDERIKECASVNEVEKFVKENKLKEDQFALIHGDIMKSYTDGIGVLDTIKQHMIF